MSEIALYRNVKGELVTHGSYSAREKFRYCPEQFRLSRIEGWKEIEERASTFFGKAIESGIQFYEEGSRQSGIGVARFQEYWRHVAELPQAKRLIYADCEVSWDSLMRAGSEMLRLYEIRVPELPISRMPKARFQVCLKKQIFPGTELSVLQNTAYLDILSYPQWDHPLLPKIARSTGVVTTPEMAGVRPLIIDCKTAGGALATELISLDPQLGEYAWQARIPDVAFLWFVKRSHRIERKARVTLLEPIGDIRAGTELFILGYDKEAERLFLGDSEALSELVRLTKGLKTQSKAYETIAATFFQARFVVSCNFNQVTTQRFQFVATRLTDEIINNVGRGVAQDTVEMVRTHNEGFYPRTGGIRFPNQKCTFCAMRGICSDNPELRDRLLTRAGDEWFSGRDED